MGKDKKNEKPLSKEALKKIEEVRKKTLALVNEQFDAAQGKKPKKNKDIKKVGGFICIYDEEAIFSALKDAGFDKKSVDPEVLAALNGKFHWELEQAAARAKANKRKTIKEHDVLASLV